MRTDAESPARTEPVRTKSRLVTATAPTTPLEIVPAPEKGPAVTSARQPTPAGKRLGSMFVSRTRTVVPFHWPSPALRTVAETLGSSPAVRVRGARRRTPTHWPAAVQVLSFVSGLPSSHTPPTFVGVCAQPVAALQEAAVH